MKKIFFKHAGIALAVQAGLLGLLVLSGYSLESETETWMCSVAEVLFGFCYFFYLPIGLLVVTLTGATGCGGMIYGFWGGIIFGIVIYSALYGAIVMLIKGKLLRREEEI